MAAKTVGYRDNTHPSPYEKSEAPMRFALFAKQLYAFNTAGS
jgi:hypothetical protein